MESNNFSQITSEEGCDVGPSQANSDSDADPEHAQGHASRGPMLVELICERAHCVIYEYAIVTAKFVAEQYKGRVKIKPVVRRGSKKNVERYLALCKLNGRHLSVPAILIAGRLAFTNVPSPEELRSAIDENLKRWENND